MLPLTPLTCTLVYWSHWLINWKLHKPGATWDAREPICRTQLLGNTFRITNSCPLQRHSSFALQNKRLPSTLCSYRTVGARRGAAQSKQQAGSVFAQLYRHTHLGKTCPLEMLSIWVVGLWQEMTQRRCPDTRVGIPREGYLCNVCAHILFHSSLTFLCKPSKFTPQ